VTAQTVGRSRGDQSLGAQVPDGIRLVGSELRSTSLERDIRDQSLNSPYVGARALDVLDRVASAVADPKRTRAWSFTGPYGSGKSTLANLLDAFLGHDPARQAEAKAAIEATSRGLADRFARARRTRASRGFLGAAATASREPLAATVHRALRTAADRKWPHNPPKPVADALAACAAGNGPSAESVMQAVTALCGTGFPLLLIIDEFGKTLEYIAADGSGSAESDAFLLQMLAEKGAGCSGLPLFICTLQHLAFTDYAADSSVVQTKEWAKVQGRFEDITFTPNLGDSVHLLLRRLDHSRIAESGRRLIEQHARASEEAWTTYGLDAVVGVTAEMFAGLYPLHPLTAVAAPLLAAQIGQHHRSLTGFLAGDEPNTVRRTLETASAAEPERATTIRLPQLYEYFFASGRATILASANASRWLEVDNRLDQAHGLPEEDRDILKAVGILNLIDADGVLGATPAMIQLALHDPLDAKDARRFGILQERLQGLVSGGFLVHRSYSDEYRVWEGSDVNINARVKEITDKLDPDDVAERLVEHLGRVLPNNVVAGAHSERTGMARFFRSAISYRGGKLDGPEAARDAADGLIVYHIGDPDARPVVNSGLPVLVGTTENPADVLRAGITLIALQDLDKDKKLDRVARREVGERIAVISRDIRNTLNQAFSPGSSKASWHLWGKGTDVAAAAGAPMKARSYAALVSQACDKIYKHSPQIRNEMAGRHELTSQGAKARRELLTRLLRDADRPVLGFDQAKYPPERSMYHGVVQYLGLHRPAGDAPGGSGEQSSGTYAVCRPSPRENPGVIPAWNALEAALAGAGRPTSVSEIYRQLMIPPYGIKAGVMPILMVAALIVHAEDVALFLDGSYCTQLTAEIVERLLNGGPDRFTVKAAPSDSGQRRRVITALSAALRVDAPRLRAARNPQLLAVTRAMLDRVRILTPYARNTRRLSRPALEIRAVLSRATDPDELVFSTAPQALGLAPITADTEEDEETAAFYAAQLTHALDELSDADACLRREVATALGQEFRLPEDATGLRRALTERLAGFADAPLELPLQGFVSRVTNTSLPDDDWLDPIVVRLSNKALGDWTDLDASNFPMRVRQMARSLDRVSQLYDMRKEQNAPTEARTSPEAAQTAPDGPKLVQTRLVTFTTPEGTEEHTLVHLPNQARAAAATLAGKVIKQAEDELGPDGARILLAMLAERLAVHEQSDSADAKETP
jgi:hypothetical protein